MRSLAHTRSVPIIEARRVRLDLIGIALAAVSIGWAMAAAILDGGDGRPLGLLIAACGGALGAAAFLGRRLHRAIVPLAIATAVSATALTHLSEITGGPLSGPFGYRNATGAFLAVGAVAWVMGGAAIGGSRWILASLVPASLLAVEALRASTGALAVVALIGVTVLASFGSGGVRAAIVASGLCLAVALLATAWLGAAYRSELATRIAGLGLTQRRLDLWHDADEIMIREPWGVGPGGFASASPTASGDRDAQQAHQEFLERGAELGWLGLGLMIALFAWGFLRLDRTSGADVVTALAAAALAGVGIQACVDHVLHAPAIPVAVAALVGTGIVPVAEHER
jgi:O-antigen ligase